VVCGDNTQAAAAARRAFGNRPNVEIHDVVDGLEALLAECDCVVTKPGISTILEARAARRKIFLLRGMPVAEDNNARHALRYFDAEWFTKESFQRWCRRAAEPAPLQTGR
jgi:UDP-N-acetylglucosamine:LPS N-acetylglucosamine transferase